MRLFHMKMIVLHIGMIINQNKYNNNKNILLY